MSDHHIVVGKTENVPALFHLIKSEFHEHPQASAKATLELYSRVMSEELNNSPKFGTDAATLALTELAFCAAKLEAKDNSAAVILYQDAVSRIDEAAQHGCHSKSLPKLAEQIASQIPIEALDPKKN